MVLRQDGTWLLLVVVQVPDSTPMQPHDVSGVNLEFANIAVTSDGDSMTGNDIEAVRRRFSTRRWALQKGTAGQKKRGKRPSCGLLRWGCRGA
jgi:putative transposase